MNELITIIINVYNGEQFINKCLDCIVNQTYKNLDILIVDDGSTDNTLNLIKNYKDKRIRIIKQKNEGLSLSRNVGIDNAKGEYIYFIDVDDYIELDTIEYLYKLMKKYKTNISTTDTYLVRNGKYKKEELTEEIKLVEGIELVKNILISEGYQGTIWNKLYKKEVFDTIRFEDRIINDVVVVYKLFLNYSPIVYSNLKKYYYIKHDTNISIKKEVKRSIDLYYATFERYNYIEERYPNLIENRICVLKMICDFYIQDKEELNKFLKEINAKKIYNKYFTLKILNTNIGIREKIKIILFRINKNLYKHTINIYLFIKRKIFRKY